MGLRKVKYIGIWVSDSKIISLQTSIRVNKNDSINVPVSEKIVLFFTIRGERRVDTETPLL